MHKKNFKFKITKFTFKNNEKSRFSRNWKSMLVGEITRRHLSRYLRNIKKKHKTHKDKFKIKLKINWKIYRIYNTLGIDHVANLIEIYNIIIKYYIIKYIILLFKICQYNLLM